MKIRNTFIIFLVSGFWHGANWTFIFWGGLNALYFLPLLIASKNRKNLGRVAFSKKEKIISDLINIVKTFILTVFAWIFFRAESLKHAFNYILGLLDSSIIHVPNFNGRNESIKVLLLIVVFMLIEWLGRDSKFALEYLGLKWKQYLRWGFYLIIFLAIIMLSGNEQQFIYFQF
jgi:D-alanyl-lipoteichoic acid acyltransferase DltB (MBOAT superfamily)|tara:strand:+ start:1237 stop:1758 length:522 start_codon:yes stop_codon:yes gene_type:complete